MSVIFGIIENDRTVILAGDRRGSSRDGRVLTDELSKVIAVNRHLAFATAGNVGIGKALENDIEKVNNKDSMTTNELRSMIEKLYQRLHEVQANFLLTLPFYFLIAGKSHNGTLSLISGGYIKGKLESNDVPMALFPPEDVDMEACSKIFAGNLRLQRETFVETTIREIAAKSQFVSRSGDKWIYSISGEKGTLSPF